MSGTATDQYAAPIYTVPGFNHLPPYGDLEEILADDVSNAPRIADDGTISALAWLLSQANITFDTQWVASNAQVAGHSNDMALWGNFGIMDPNIKYRSGAVIGASGGLLVEHRPNIPKTILHYRNGAAAESLEGLLPNTAHGITDTDIGRTPVTAESPNGRIWFSVNHAGGDVVFVEKRAGGSGVSRWHSPPSIGEGAIRLNTRGEAITSGRAATQTALGIPPKIWRNGKYTDLNELTSKPEAATISYAIDLASNGIILAQAELTSKPEAATISYAIDLASNGIILAQATENGVTKTGLLLPVEVVSRDKFLAGSFSIPSGWDSLEMEFVGPDGSLGKYGNLLGGGSTKIYDKVEDIMADPDYAAGGQVATQKVWFVKDSTDARKINYYTCFDSTGEVKIKLYLNGKPESLGEITHTLTAAPDFAAVIDYVDQWVKGTSFDFTGGGITPPLAMRSASAQSSVSEGIHNLTRAALIPFFNVVNNVEGLGSVAFGLFDGIKEGVSDDYKLLVLIKSGVLGAGGWAIQAAEAELNKWKDDPLKRAAELKKAADRLCQEWVFKPMEQVQADLSTWEGFKKRSWQTWNSVKGTANKAWVLTKDSWGSIKTGLSDWVNDFADRMMEGAEKAHWSESVFVMDKISGDINESSRQAGYTFGYTLGYIGEQAVVGVLTGGTVKAGAILTKGGVRVAGALAARRVLPIVARLQFVKKWAASVAISIEMKIAVERGLTIAAEAPLSALIKDSVAEIIERGMARATYERASFSTSKILDEVLNATYLKKLILTPGLEGRFWQRMGEWFHLLAEDATAVASKGWVKAFNRSLKFDGYTLLDDRISDLYKLMKAETAEGKKALKKSLEEFGATDGNGKLWLREVEKIQAEGYRYSSFDPRFRDGNRVPGPPILKTSDQPAGGWYTSFDKFDDAASAIDASQLPTGSTAQFRLEFDFSAVNQNVRLPRGSKGGAEWFEGICKDYPNFGGGGATQLLVEDIDIPIKAIWDISGTTPRRIFP